MLGIIDVGGGLKGIYGAGIFDFCLDNDIKFDYCIGVSAGSANIASFLGMQKGRNRKFYSEYIFRKNYMSLHNLLIQGSYINLDYIYGGLSNSNGENPLNYDGIINSDSIFKVVATDAVTGKAVYFDKNDMLQDDYDIFKASCCIPVVCRPYHINNKPFFDGGISDPLPIKKCIIDGCDRIVVILTSPLGLCKPDKTDRILSSLLTKCYPESAKNLLLRHNKYNEGIRLAMELENKGRAIIISPDDCCGVSTLTKNYDNLLELYHKGYNDAENILSFVKRRKKSSFNQVIS